MDGVDDDNLLGTALDEEDGIVDGAKIGDSLGRVVTAGL
jgi:hypothetical protein